MIAFDGSKLLEQSSERDIYNTGSIVTNYIVTLDNYVEIITMMYTSHLYTVNLVKQKGMFYNEAKTHKKLKRTLFVRTKIQFASVLKSKHINSSKERCLLRQKH